MVYINKTDGGPLTAENVKETFLYNKRSGNLYRRMAQGIQKVGTVRPDKHKVVAYNRHSYRTTYIIWLLVYGRPPNGDVDHINNDASDDRLSNLRECTRSQNMQNASMSKRNKTGVKGVHWDKQRAKWNAYIRANGRNINLGRFDSIEQATEVRLRAEREFFESFGR
jgi:HNH endonuclease/AP2 domain